ncbi:hypothetical protein C3Z06_23670 [Cupriavidus metallidurans]|nr:hypothetical protein C3Z06_23670 [Cupriavidus metallidurans]
MARRHWTPEQRAWMAETIRRWRPWERSTGPVTASGKAEVSQHALRHGMRSVAAREQQREIAALLRACKERLRRA